MFGEQFYPTPPELAARMLAPYFTDGPVRGRAILEPSAGSGALIEAAVDAVWEWMEERNRLTELSLKPEQRKHARYYYRQDAEKALLADISACEVDPDLSAMLAGKGVSLVGGDFMAYDTPHRFDLIMMNPPFSTGVNHVLKAWELLAPGGDLVALLNATTMDKATAASGALRAIIQNNGTHVVLEGEFVDSQRPTGVSVALIRVRKKQEFSKNLFDMPDAERVPEFEMEEGEMLGGGELASRDVVATLLLQYATAVDYYVTYRRSCRRMGALESLFDWDRDKPNPHRPPGQASGDDQQEFRVYIDRLTQAAWNTVFRLTGMEGRLTERVKKEFDAMKTKASVLAFTRANIFEVLTLLADNSGHIMKQAILDCFDLLTRYHDDNREHMEGWKTNDAYRVRQRCIIPHCIEYTSYWGYKPSYRVELGLMADLDKGMCFLAGKKIENIVTIGEAIKALKGTPGNTCSSEFFDLKVFKKGTLHIKFRDAFLWQEFNILVARERNWLPG